MFRVTVLFSETSGKTKMDMSMALPTPEAAEETRKFIKKAGGDSTWDRLAEYLEKESSGKDQFVINRTFDAPLEVMFEMWTNPKHFSKWLAADGIRHGVHPVRHPAGRKHVFLHDEPQRRQNVRHGPSTSKLRSPIVWSTRSSSATKTTRKSLAIRWRRRGPRPC